MQTLAALESRNPHNNDFIADYPQHDDDEVHKILSQVTAARIDWAKRSTEDRSQPLLKLADTLESRVEAYAMLMTSEMGKPVSQAKGEIEKCAWVCRYYAEKAAEFLAPISIESDADRSGVVFQPLGNVLAIMPWNFPFWQAFRFAVPAIAAGNGIVLKHASNVSGCAMAIESAFAEAFPENLMRTVLVSSSRTKMLIEHEQIAAVTFTGSTGAGREVAATAGAALKKSVLELGGSDPYVVLADADPVEAARICAKARIVNSGQSCIAAKRFIVVEEIFDEFVEEMKRIFATLKAGDPKENDTDLGPLARPDLVDALNKQVEQTLAQGARKIEYGGVESEGAYFVPTILLDVTSGMTAFREELFGPVAPIIRAGSDAEAVRLANASDFGLGSAVFTADAERGWALAAEEIQAGAVAINGQLQSDPRLPFGGIRNSGYGRELGEFGIREFVNVKTLSLFARN